MEERAALEALILVLFCKYVLHEEQEAQQGHDQYPCSQPHSQPRFRPQPSYVDHPVFDFQGQSPCVQQDSIADAPLVYSYFGQSDKATPRSLWRKVNRAPMPNPPLSAQIRPLYDSLAGSQTHARTVRALATGPLHPKTSLV